VRGEVALACILGRQREQQLPARARMPVVDRPQRAAGDGHLVVAGDAAQEHQLGALAGRDVRRLAGPCRQGARQREQVIGQDMAFERLDERADADREPIAVCRPAGDVAGRSERLQQVVRGGAAQPDRFAELLRGAPLSAVGDLVEQREGPCDGLDARLELRRNRLDGHAARTVAPSEQDLFYLNALDLAVRSRRCRSRTSSTRWG
jgi:hypothetical protein